MAVYPGGYNEKRATRFRTIFYVVVVVVVLCIASAIGYVIVSRHRGAKPTQDLPAPSAEMVAEVKPAEPIPVEPQPGPNAAAPVTATVITAEPDKTVPALVTEAMELVNRQPPRIIEARDRLNELLPMTGGQQRAFVKEQLTALSDKWLFSNVVFTGDKLCSSYRVSPGDLLTKIGEMYNVPYEILMQINGIERPELLRAGATLKVINGPFNAIVYRSTFTMDLYLQNTYVKSFKVGLGKAGMETPAGRWRVKEGGKLVKPIWTDPISGKTYHPEDPDYPLGSRWIALEGIEGAAVGRTGFAIHGTKDPEQIGSPGSQGCIRLHNGDAITVYNLMMPGVSLVDVRN
ncbi:MAG: L,D-transpeptidase family protein [Planctomycetota bacterium]